MAEAKNLAMSMSKEKKIPYINGYDHPHIVSSTYFVKAKMNAKWCERFNSQIAGQGTIGLEICEQVKDADAIVVPVGGG